MEPRMTRRRRVSFLTALCLPLAAVGLAACGGGGNAAPTPPKTPSGHVATIGLERDGDLAKVLVDSRGRTLSLFKGDAGGKSACMSACAAAWPPVRANGKPLAGPGVPASKLATQARSDGPPQVVYNGHPLYRYTGDTKLGDTNGQGLRAFGAAWFAVSGSGDPARGGSPKPGGG